MPATIDTHKALRDACIEHYRHIAAALLREDAELGLDLHLTIGQLKAMMALGLHGHLAVGALGRTLGISEPAASFLVDQLEKEGLVRREHDPDDRRRVLVTPSAEALTRVDRFRHGRVECALEWLDGLADDDLEALAKGLGALADLAESRSMSEASPR